jgi:hypothetical protein
MKRNGEMYLLILTLSLILLMIGCKDIDLQSTWRDREIKIDGSDAEWKNLLMYHEKSKIAFASCNDEHYLYLVMVVADRDERRMIMRSGFTVWFDGSGGSDESFGVHFPLGMQGGPKSISENREDIRTSKKEESKEPSFEMKETELEIIGPGDGETNRMSTPGGKGIQISMSHSQDRLVYELKIALKRTVDEPYGISAENGTTIGVGFAVNESEIHLGSGPPSGGPGGDSGGGFGGGPGGGPPSGGPGGSSGSSRGQQQSQSTLNIWANLQLAIPNSGPK